MLWPLWMKTWLFFVMGYILVLVVSSTFPYFSDVLSFNVACKSTDALQAFESLSQDGILGNMNQGKWAFKNKATFISNNTESQAFCKK